MPEPVICFGQQPCGFFPKRYLYSKIVSARKLRQKIGARIVYFFHDSDHDYRETITLLRNRKTGALDRLNFHHENKLQKRFAPLFAKRIPEQWQEKTARRLPCYVPSEKVALFKSVGASTVADFCLEMYRGMGLLEGIEVVRSSDPAVRRKAVEVNDYFADLRYEGEWVRARRRAGKFALHKGGDNFIELPDQPCERDRISPTRDTRLVWMQSVVNCTHYITGAGEFAYLNRSETPEIEFVKRDFIENPEEAFIG